MWDGRGGGCFERVECWVLSVEWSLLAPKQRPIRNTQHPVRRTLAPTLQGADPTPVRETMDQLKDKLKSAAIVLATTSDGKVSLAAGVTTDLIAKIKAGDLVNHVANQVGGKGGGKPDMAMAGGTDASQLPKALASVKDWVSAKLAN